MNKHYRQGQILKLIRSRNVYTQEELAQALRDQGIPATQVTLSRDIRELGLAKTADGYRHFEAEAPGPDISIIAREFLMDVRLAQNLVVLKTAPAHASSVAAALDHEDLAEVLGTLAGDDTVLVICADNQQAEAVRARLLSMLE
jgi:transcriptional regulator of arginine metabolism